MPSRFPAAFRPPAFASWAILFPLRSCAFLTVGRPGGCFHPDPNGVTTFHTSEIRPGWVLPLPRGGGVRSPVVKRMVIVSAMNVDGKILGAWVCVDLLGVIRQLAGISAPTSITSDSGS